MPNELIPVNRKGPSPPQKKIELFFCHPVWVVVYFTQQRMI